jgi:DNA topoisomerase II
MKSSSSMDISNNNLNEEYQMLTDLEHILKAPDTYIGSIMEDKIPSWIMNNDSERMSIRECKVVPGLYKCLDEIIVNSKDHVTRMNQKIEKMQSIKKEHDHKPVTTIDVSVSKESGVLSVMNDGDGIDVEKHPEYNIWIPEMVFGHLRTSTNYKKDDAKIVGGKNGFGVKLVFIYSKWAKIETVDHIRGLKYVQEFKDNLSVIEKPKVTKCKGKPYTKVSWLPDYERFGLVGLTDDMDSIFYKRCIDISAITGKTVKVKYNGSLIGVKTFEQYIELFAGKKNESKQVYEKGNERWEYAVCLSPTDEFTQVSFVNGIYTGRGGKHVDYILQQITKKVVEYIDKKKKVKVKPVTIKEQLMLFVNCVVENPSFDSQTKDTLNTSASLFGSTCKVSDKFIDKVCKLGIMEQAISIHQVKETKDSKKTDGKKTKRILGIPKLIDANFAGSVQSKKCTLILCEGDSAKSGIVSGLSKEDRNVIGIYPLKGKLMNVRDCVQSKINDNKEISDIKKIMGLETTRQYKTIDDVHKHLRYGKIIFMTDQDLDGTHIKGLCINLFDSQWSQLLQCDEFIGFMNTPIIKAKKGKKEMRFYNDKEYNDWKEDTNTSGWTIKYYKGLGTSTSSEFKEYFVHKKIVNFTYDDTSSDALDKVFRRTRTEDRKKWLEQYDKDSSIDTSLSKISYDQFVNRELIHFSKYDCERSIPNLMDGLKTSQRKIIYCCFKRNLVKEIKVAQFGGYVSEHSGYHHGEMSLMQAIVGMAQNFVGSNNINLLLPNGQFGTRMQGGSDSASERYIFTQLNPLTRKIFKPEDEAVLNYLDDDGSLVEPEHYVPIIPTILVNGSVGIGTGFSTIIPSYNPKDIVHYVRNKLTEDDKNTIELLPYYKDFTGTITKIQEQCYLVKGVYTVVNDNKIHITELPIGTWTENYKLHLEKLITNDKKGKKLVKDYCDMSTDTKVDITVTFYEDCLGNLMYKQIEHGCSQLENILNLYTTKRTTNMHMFDEKQQLKKFNSPEEIIDYFIPIRLHYYEERKKHQLSKLEREVCLLSNKARFIEQQCNDEIDLRRKKKDQVVTLLKTNKYDVIDGDVEYKYLRTMQIDHFIEENILKLRNETNGKVKEMNALKITSTKEIWLRELNELEKDL